MSEREETNGKLPIEVGDKRIQGGPGSYVFGPREVPHGFRTVGTRPSRMLRLATPAGFERFVLVLAEPASGPGFPPAGPPDRQRLMAAAAERHIEFLGPLPE